MALFDPATPEVPTAIGRVVLQIYSVPGEDGIDYGGRVGFQILDADNEVLDERRATLEADDLTVQQKQALRDMLIQLRTQAEGTLP